MTREELERLRRLAAEATSGPWFDTQGAVWIDTREQVCCGRACIECCGEPDVIGGQELIAQSGEHDAAFIAAANPSVITALLDHIDSLEREAKAGRELRDMLEVDAWLATKPSVISMDGLLKGIEIRVKRYDDTATKETASE